MLAVKEYGMPCLQNPMTKGNLFVEFEIVWPTFVPQDQVVALRKALTAVDDFNGDDDAGEVHFFRAAVIIINMLEEDAGLDDSSDTIMFLL